MEVNKKRWFWVKPDDFGHLKQKVLVPFVQEAIRKQKNHVFDSLLVFPNVARARLFKNELMENDASRDVVCYSPEFVTAWPILVSAWLRKIVPNSVSPEISESSELTLIKILAADAKLPLSHRGAQDFLEASRSEKRCVYFSTKSLFEFSTKKSLGMQWFHYIKINSNKFLEHWPSCFHDVGWQELRLRYDEVKQQFLDVVDQELLLWRECFFNSEIYEAFLDGRRSLVFWHWFPEGTSFWELFKMFVERFPFDDLRVFSRIPSEYPRHLQYLSFEKQRERRAHEFRDMGWMGMNWHLEELSVEKSEVSSPAQEFLWFSQSLDKKLEFLSECWKTHVFQNPEEEISKMIFNIRNIVGNNGYESLEKIGIVIPGDSWFFDDVEMSFVRCGFPYCRLTKRSWMHSSIAKVFLSLVRLIVLGFEESIFFSVVLSKKFYWCSSKFQNGESSIWRDRIARRIFLWREDTKDVGDADLMIALKIAHNKAGSDKEKRRFAEDLSYVFDFQSMLKKQSDGWMKASGSVTELAVLGEKLLDLFLLPCVWEHFKGEESVDLVSEMIADVRGLRVACFEIGQILYSLNAYQAMDFLRVAEELLSSGNAPRVSDSGGKILVGSLDVMNGRSFSHLFILGSGNGVYPKNLSDEEKSIKEWILLCDVISCVEKTVCVSRSLEDGNGRPVDSSPFFERIFDFVTKENDNIEHSRTIAFNGIVDTIGKISDRTVLSFWKNNGNELFLLNGEEDRFLFLDRIFCEKRRLALNFSEDGFIAPGMCIGVLNSMSVTDLETYAQCPHRFFFRKVWGLKAYESRGNKRILGLVLHELAHRIFSEKDVFISSLDLRHIQGVVKSLAHVVISENKHWFAKPDVLLQRHSQIFEKFSSFLLEFYKKFKNSKGKSEWKVQFCLSSLPDSEVGHEETVSGTIDCVLLSDVDKDNVLVVEYKTGRKKSVPEFRRSISEGLSFQPYVYSFALSLELDKHVGDVAFEQMYVLEPSCVQKTLRLCWSDEQSKREEILKKANVAVLSVVREIRNRNFSPRPHSSATCRQCSFSQVCRVRGLEIDEKKEQ